jgi:hypothetical protein
MVFTVSKDEEVPCPLGKARLASLLQQVLHLLTQSF